MTQFTSPESLAESIGASTNFIHTTIGLDKGCLAKSESTLYFLGPRMGGWEIVEQTPIQDIIRVDITSNFMGETTLIVCKNGRWQCKQMTEGVTVQEWLSIQENLPSGPESDDEPEDLLTQSDTQKESSPNSIASTSISDKLEVTEEPPGQTLPELVTTTPTPLSSPVSIDTNPSIHDDLSDTLVNGEEESGTSCIGTIVKWFVYIWLFGLLMDFCDSL